jgi:nucleotide-binding universal stress UspA family protein
MNSSSAGRLDAARAALASGGPRGALEPGVNASEGLETEIAFEPSQSKALTAMRVEELDLLVLGSRRPGLVRRQSFSGLSSRLLRAALCPVVVVRGGVADHVDDSNGSAVSVAHNGAHAGTQAR